MKFKALTKEEHIEIVTACTELYEYTYKLQPELDETFYSLYEKYEKEFNNSIWNKIFFKKHMSYKQFKRNVLNVFTYDEQDCNNNIHYYDSMHKYTLNAKPHWRFNNCTNSSKINLVPTFFTMHKQMNLSDKDDAFVTVMCGLPLFDPYFVEFCISIQKYSENPGTLTYDEHSYANSIIRYRNAIKEYYYARK